LYDLHTISYTSSATGSLSTEQISQLLQHARARNRRESVTGVLLFAEGTFHQYIEGPREGLLRVYDAILCAPLHHQIFELVSEPISAREFSNWPMGYRGDRLLADASDEPDLNQILADETVYLSPGRLLLNAFWLKGLGARYQAAMDSCRQP
jgi:hypothetical protein